MDARVADRRRGLHGDRPQELDVVERDLRHVTRLGHDHPEHGPGEDDRHGDVTLLGEFATGHDGRLGERSRRGGNRFHVAVDPTDAADTRPHLAQPGRGKDADIGDGQRRFQLVGERTQDRLFVERAGEQRADFPQLLDSVGASLRERREGCALERRRDLLREQLHGPDPDQRRPHSLQRIFEQERTERLAGRVAHGHEQRFTCGRGRLRVRVQEIGVADPEVPRARDWCGRRESECHAAEAESANRLDEDLEARFERGGSRDVSQRLVQQQEMIALALQLVQCIRSDGEWTFGQRRGTSRWAASGSTVISAGVGPRSSPSACSTRTGSVVRRKCVPFL